MRRSKMLVGGCVTLLAACATQQGANMKVPDETVIRQLNAQWEQAAMAGNAAGVAAFYTEEAFLLPPKGMSSMGRSSIHASWKAILQPGVAVSREVVKIEAASAGDLAYLVGSYRISGDGGSGKLLEVWKKQADGTWKCAAASFHPD